MKLLAKPPRGIGETGDAARATSFWASSEDISEHEFESGGVIIGELPCPADWAYPKIEAIRHKQEQIAQDISRDAELRVAEIAGLQDEIDELAETGHIDIGISDDQHMGLIAGSRGGKTSTVLLPILESCQASAVVLDPKAELSNLTAEWRALPASKGGLGQTVHVIDPFGASGIELEQRACFNPLDLIDLEEDRAIDIASSTAEALIQRSNKENEHFDDSARTFIKALIVFVAEFHEGRITRNLVTVYRLLTRGAELEMGWDKGQPKADDDPHPFDYLLKLMKGCEAYDGVVSAAATTLEGMGDRERGAVLSTARRNMEFLEKRPIKRALSASSFKIDSLKTDPNGVTLYICLPPQRMDDCGRFLRLAVTLILERIYEIKGPPATGHQILLLLEELPVLGYLKPIEQASGYAASFGVRMLWVVQDLSQLKKNFSDSWETFLGNAGILMAFANSDVTTLEYLSKKLGETEVSQTSHNLTNAVTLSQNDPSAQAQMQVFLQNRGRVSLIANPATMFMNPVAEGESQTSTESASTQLHRTPLLLPDEVERLFRRENHNQLVMIKGERPFILRRAPFKPRT